MKFVALPTPLPLGNVVSFFILADCVLPCVSWSSLESIVASCDDPCFIGLSSLGPTPAAKGCDAVTFAPAPEPSSSTSGFVVEDDPCAMGEASLLLPIPGYASDTSVASTMDSTIDSAFLFNKCLIPFSTDMYLSPNIVVQIICTIYTTYYFEMLERKFSNTLSLTSSSCFRLVCSISFFVSSIFS